jgi:hypothetical protein
VFQGTSILPIAVWGWIGGRGGLSRRGWVEVKRKLRRDYHEKRRKRRDRATEEGEGGEEGKEM